MRRNVLALACALLLSVAWSCGQQTWEAAMQAGEAAVQRGQYEEAERIYAAAVKKAEEFGVHDRRVAVTLARLAQAYSAQGEIRRGRTDVSGGAEDLSGCAWRESSRCGRDAQQPRVLHRKHGQFADAQRLLTRRWRSKRNCWGRSIWKLRWR